MAQLAKTLGCSEAKQLLGQTLEEEKVVAQCARTEEQRKALLRHAAIVERGCHIGLPEEADRQVVIDSYQKVINMLGIDAYKERT